MRVVAWLIVLGCVWPCTARAEEGGLPVALDIGGRFEYAARLADESPGFPWNFEGGASSDRSRLMLDVDTDVGAWGRLYLKGAAAWDERRMEEKQRTLRFAQGDYLWQRGEEKGRYRFRLFANERRFFVADRVAPLVTDDVDGETRDNRGIRLDGSRGRFDAQVVYAFLGEDDEAPRLGFARTAWRSGFGTMSATYRVDDVQATGSRNRSTIKAELATGYKHFSAVVSYAQSGLDDGDLFFPGARVRWDRLDAGVSEALPAGGALTTEFRLAPVRAGGLGALKLVYRYDAVGGMFLPRPDGTARPGVSHTTTALFRAADYHLSARLRHRHHADEGLRSLNFEAVDADVTAVLANGLEVLSRARYVRIESAVSDPERPTVHVALGRRGRRVMVGAHMMRTDIDTPLETTRFAFDGKLVLSPDWGLHWRFVSGDDVAGESLVFARLEYRPNDRVFVTLDYGHAFAGDGPFLLEDLDVGSVHIDSALYTLTLRGDF